MYSKNTGHFSTVCFQHKVCLEVTAGSSLSSKDNDREFEDFLLFWIVWFFIVFYCSVVFLGIHYIFIIIAYE